MTPRRLVVWTLTGTIRARLSRFFDYVIDIAEELLVYDDEMDGVESNPGHVRIHSGHCSSTVVIPTLRIAKRNRLPIFHTIDGRDHRRSGTDHYPHAVRNVRMVRALSEERGERTAQSTTDEIPLRSLLRTILPTSSSDATS